MKSTLAGAQRFLAHQTTTKEPITVSQLEQLVPPRRTQWPLCITFVRLLFAYKLLLPFSDLMSLLGLFDPMLRSKMICLSYLFNLVKLISIVMELGLL